MTQPPSHTRLASDGLPPLRDVIGRHELRAKKSLGQNFLLDLNLTRKIARQCGDLAGRTVVEIGPGPGGLTRALLSEGAGHVLAIERDDRCRPALDAIATNWPDRLHILQADALAVDIPAELAARGLLGPDKPVIAANLPYSIATRLLTGWLTHAPWPPWYGAMVLMFQKEVAERIVADAGTPSYGRLSVLAQWRCEAEIVMHLPPAAFVPPPKVSSAVVRFIPRQTLPVACTTGAVERVTQALFGQRRKMLRGSLKQLTPNPDALLRRLDISGERRAETLPVETILKLAILVEAGDDEQSHE